MEIMETNVGDIVDSLKCNSNVTFPHSISGDRNNPRNMTAGVMLLSERFLLDQGGCLMII